MAKSLPFHSFPLKVIVLHLSLSLAFTTLHCAKSDHTHTLLTFFMHDILGGSSPSERVVAGTTVLNTKPTNNLPFSKPNNRVFPNNMPFPAATSIVDNTNTINGGTVIISNIGTHSNVVINKRDMLPYVQPGTLPLGATVLDKVVFGRITVIDYEVTQGPDLGASQAIGKAQGFHLASSLDGSSKTMAFTVLFGDDEEDTISFFGVHRTAAGQSSIAVVGGTGKYGNAKGYAKLETPPSLHDQQLTSNGVHTVLQTTVYLTL